MKALGAVFPVLFGVLLVIQVIVGWLRLSRGRRLGPALLEETDGSRWFAVVWLVLGLSKVLDYLHGESIWSVCLQAGVFGLGAVFWWWSRGFSVHAEGIRYGMTVVYWSELEGWGWDSGKRTLLIWSRSWWVRVMSVRPVNGLDTGQKKTGELEELLERFAGEARRA